MHIMLYLSMNFAPYKLVMQISLFQGQSRIKARNQENVIVMYRIVLKAYNLGFQNEKLYQFCKAREAEITVKPNRY